MPDAPRHFQLLALAEVWASVAGTPPEMVLRNLCDWAMVGAFPDDALVTATGDRVDPFDLFMSRKALSAGLNGVELDGIETHNPKWGASFLQDVFVSEAGLWAFCERTKTAMPSTWSRRLRWFLVAGGWHIAPPPCPEAEEHAARHQARVSALAAIDSLRAILAGLQGKPTRFGPRRTEDGDIDLEHWGKKWDLHRDRALSGITRCGDAQLERGVQSLDSEWAAALSAERQKHAAAPAAAVEPTTPAHAADDAEEVVSDKRSAGQFSRAALETWYREEWVTQNTTGGKIPSRESDWKAAKARFDDGVSRGAIRELRRRLAPPSWKEKGRRKSGDGECSADLPEGSDQGT